MTTTENKDFILRYFAALSGQPKPAALVREYTNE